jgi:hypothetical protein
MRKNDSSGKVTTVGEEQGPEKVNDTYLKTLHAGTMARGFTVFVWRATAE